MKGCYYEKIYEEDRGNSGSRRHKEGYCLACRIRVALLVSIFDLVPLPFDAAWISVILCGIPIILEAVIGLVTAFDIKADVLVSIALIASLCIGEDFCRRRSCLYLCSLGHCLRI